jgi:hypothetical protein
MDLMQTDNETRKKALVDELGGPNPDILAGNTGVSGGIGALGGTPSPDPIVAPQADPIPASAIQSTAPVADYGRLMGYDAGRLGDPNKHDFKYDTGRTLSQFDPRQGITPDVLAALNKLDYGTFSGSGDKLSLSGAKNAKDAADFANQDWIGAYKAQNDATKWNFGGGGAAPAPAPAPSGGGGLFSGSTISPMLQGNAQDGINQALSNIGGLADSTRLRELIKALGGQA